MLWMRSAYLSASRPISALRSFHSLPGFWGLRTAQLITPPAHDQFIYPVYDGFVWVTLHPRLATIPRDPLPSEDLQTPRQVDEHAQIFLGERARQRNEPPDQGFPRLGR